MKEEKVNIKKRKENETVIQPLCIRGTFIKTRKILKYIYFSHIIHLKGFCYLAFTR